MTSARAGTKRKPVHRVRSRREVLVAVGGAAAVVLTTALLIWLMRPGTAAPGTGGIMSRQPRAAWLVGLTLVALGGFTWWVLKRQRRWPGKVVVVLVAGWLLVLLAAVLAGILWPGGLLRRYATAPAVDPSLFPSTSLPELPTTVPGETTVPGAPDTVAPTPTTGSP